VVESVLREGVEAGELSGEIDVQLTAAPPVVHSPRALLADRLARKLPAPPTEPPAAAPLAECDRCRDPLPRGQRSGTCTACEGAPSRPPAKALAPHAVTQLAAAVRQALRAAPAPV
ncbi:hypothetical protein AB0O40_36420, partial [Streptomyces sp. NPDC089919]